MSSTRGGAATDPLRHFPTPAWAVDAILPELPLCGTIVDAGCGAGAVMDRVRRLCAASAKLIGVELQHDLADESRALYGRPNALEAMHPWPLVEVVEADFLTWDPEERIDTIIGNPPFSRGEEFCRRARELTRPHGGTVAMLLRLDWLGSQERRLFLETDPPDANVLERRPQFRKGADGKPGTDSGEYSWMVWSPGRGGRWRRLRCAPADRRRKLRRLPVEPSDLPTLPPGPIAEASDA